MVRPVAPRDLDAEAESAPSESFATLERGANTVGEYDGSSRAVGTTALNARGEDDGSVRSVLSAAMVVQSKETESPSARGLVMWVDVRGEDAIRLC